MVEESDIDTLAVSVGSVHGQSSRLDLSLLEEIAGVTPAPLVLHGVLTPNWQTVGVPACVAR